MKREAGERTLLTSVVLSAPGPIVVGVGLFLGRSFTQYADFIRRTAELAAILASWMVFRALRRGGGPDAARKARLERTANLCVGAAMCLSGAAMLAIALLARGGEKGNVLPGLMIAVLGVATNSWLWLRYRRLDRERPDAILAAQGRLYRAKSLVDACVTVALATVAAAPGAPAARYMDLGGSAAVAVYLIASGIMAIRAR